MSPEWLAAITVIAVNLFTAGVVYGSLQRQTKNNTKAIEKLEQEVQLEQDQQWSKINKTAEDLSNLRGRQEINGVAKGAGGHH